MPLDLDQAFGLHARMLGLRAQRAEVLAANLANSDTPGYKARDFDFAALLAAGPQAGLPPVTLATTHASHQQADGTLSGGAEMLYRVPHQASLDGNTVDTQIEQAEFARNAMHYQASLTFLSGRIRTLLTAIRGD